MRWQARAASAATACAVQMRDYAANRFPTLTADRDSLNLNESCK